MTEEERILMQELERDRLLEEKHQTAILNNMYKMEKVAYNAEYTAPVLGVITMILILIFGFIGYNIGSVFGDTGEGGGALIGGISGFVLGMILCHHTFNSN